MADPEFGRPDHALFARVPGFDRRRAAEVFLARAEADAEFRWTPEVVELIGLLPASRSLPALRRAWDDGGLEEAILPVLAHDPRPEDREKFLAGLGSLQPAVVRLCLEALDALPRGDEGAEASALIRALGRLPEGPEQSPLRDRIAATLPPEDRPGTRQRPAGVGRVARQVPSRGCAAGRGRRRRPRFLERHAWPRWTGRRATPSGAGSSSPGPGCAACHSGAQALGPDLRGVTGRFSRDDLFTAILQPGRDISRALPDDARRHDRTATSTRAWSSTRPSTA